MAGVLKPFGSLVNPNRLRVPLGRLSIDWQNPLTNGLVCCYVPGVMSGVNIAGLGANLILSGTPAFKANIDGPGVDTITAPGYLSVLAPATLKVPPVGASLFWRGLIYGTVSPWATAISVDYDTSQSSPYNVYSFMFQTSTAVLRMYMNGSGSQNLVDSYTMTANLITNIGGTFYNATTASQMYANGVAVSAGSINGGTPTTSATTTISIGKDLVNAVPQASNTNTAIACIWTRPLSAAEQLQMSLDPYGFLLPAEYELPILNVTTVAFTWLSMDSAVETRALASRKVTDLVGY